MSFYVHASNVHTDTNKKFGPFPGAPQLTYDMVRVWGAEAGDKVDGDVIFQYSEAHEGSYQADDKRVHSDGWRRCVRVNAGGRHAYQVNIGEIFTDLTIIPTEDEATIHDNSGARYALVSVEVALELGSGETGDDAVVDRALAALGDTSLRIDGGKLIGIQIAEGA